MRAWCERADTCWYSPCSRLLLLCHFPSVVKSRGSEASCSCFCLHAAYGSSCCCRSLTCTGTDHRRQWQCVPVCHPHLPFRLRSGNDLQS